MEMYRKRMGVNRIAHNRVQRMYSASKCVCAPGTLLIDDDTDTRFAQILYVRPVLIEHHGLMPRDSCLFYIRFIAWRNPRINNLEVGNYAIDKYSNEHQLYVNDVYG